MEISRILWKSEFIGSAVLGATLWVGASAMATEITSVVQKTQPQTVELLSADTTQEKTTTSQTELQKSTVAQAKTLGTLSPSKDEPAVSNKEPVLLGEGTEDASDAGVLEQINNYSNPLGTDSLDQVTNVSQLRDVSPRDWAFEALRSLVERYGCIAGYPDGTYRGNRAMSRYEFAAGLNSCLQQIERLIASNTAEFVSRNDLETLQRLVQEFETELTTLGTRIDNLDGRVAFLEDHQFSTTTKLDGEVIFGLASVLTGENADGNDIEEVPVLGNRTRLNFETSFTGKDLLRARLATGNFLSSLMLLAHGKVSLRLPNRKTMMLV
jgi:hypothetical protein